MQDQNRKKSKVIALCGKGGVGKTSISAMIIKILIEDPGKKVLAIDADPAIGLAIALGMKVNKTVDDIRNALIKRVEKGDSEDRTSTVARLDYEMFSALTEKENLAFLAIGRPEKEGCYCQVNHILKDIIASMADHFDYVVIDGEAGVEQVNRRVMEKVSHLILVSDASVKGLTVAQTIQDVSRTAIQFEKSGLIINRIQEEMPSIPQDMSLIGMIPEDNPIRLCDMQGCSILLLPESSAVQKVRKCITRMGIM